MNFISKFFVFSLFALSSTAQAISIDGDLNDWIGSPQGKISDWKPAFSNVSYDDDDKRSSYDAEALYVTRDALNFYIAIISDKLLSGNLGFDFTKGGSYDFNVENNDDKTKIEYDHKKGSIDIINQAAEYNDKSIKKLGLFDGKHYLLEARISKSLFNSSDLNKSLLVSWGFCEDGEQDSISTTLAAASNVPTPEILPMLAMGLMMFAAYKSYRGLTIKSATF
jgi:hypothetical protein